MFLVSCEKVEIFNFNCIIFFPLTDINGFLSFVCYKSTQCKQSAMFMQVFGDTQLAFAFSKLAIETLEQGVKYVQS